MHIYLHTPGSTIIFIVACMLYPTSIRFTRQDIDCSLAPTGVRPHTAAPAQKDSSAQPLQSLYPSRPIRDPRALSSKLDNNTAQDLCRYLDTHDEDLLPPGCYHLRRPQHRT